MIHTATKGDWHVRERITFSGADPRARFIAMLLANGLLALTVTLIYFGLSALLSPFFSRRDAPMAYLLATITIALTIVPVRRRVRAVITRLLHKDWQTGQELLRDIGEALSRTIDPEAVRALLVDDLPQRLRIQDATLWMLEPPDDLALRRQLFAASISGGSRLGCAIPRARRATSDPYACRRAAGWVLWLWVAAARA
jgi:hypothetical protein